jgi:hypothetical protein
VDTPPPQRKAKILQACATGGTIICEKADFKADFKPDYFCSRLLS